MRLKINELMAIDTGMNVIMTIKVPHMYAQMVDAFKQMFKPNEEYELKLCRKKRSLDSNALCWALCSEIAQVVGTTKEEVYRDAISHVGVFEVLQFTSEDALRRFKLKWMANGEGWLTKTLDKEKMVLMAYYGSSRYDTKEMSVLIDYLANLAKSLGIQFMTEAEIDLIKREWK